MERSNCTRSKHQGPSQSNTTGHTRIESQPCLASWTLHFSRRHRESMWINRTRNFWVWFSVFRCTRRWTGSSKQSYCNYGHRKKIWSDPDSRAFPNTTRACAFRNRAPVVIVVNGVIRSSQLQLQKRFDFKSVYSESRFVVPKYRCQKE